MLLVDTHVHLQHKRYAGDLDEILQRARQAGVEGMIVVGFDLASSREAVQLAASTTGVRAVVGIHPHSASEAGSEALQELEALAAEPQTAGVGETGLDFHYMESSRQDQLKALEAHLEIACRVERPIVIHDREAHEDVWEALRGFPVERLGGVWHCFSGDMALAERVVSAGYYLGIGGIVTFSADLARLVAQLPLEHIVLETDAPYLAPVPHRGRRNEPALTRVIAEAVAGIKGCSLETVAEVTTANAGRLFGLPTA